MGECPFQALALPLAPPRHLGATSGPPRGHLGATSVPAVGREYGTELEPSHSRRIPGRCPRAAESGDSDIAGRRRGQMATAGKGSKRKGAGVRFTPEGTQGHHQEGTQGHVHFQEQLHDSAVMVTQDKDGHFLVKVGFLKILHKYEITFLLPPTPSLGKDICPLPVPNPNLRIISVTPLPEGHSVRCEYMAHKEGVLKEELLLAGHSSGPIKVTVQARVMDRHHGTPMLLDGVRCMGAELEYDSEQSEWHGFD